MLGTRRKSMLKHLWINTILLVIVAGTAFAQSALNNDSITKMAKAGLGDDVIVSMIKGQPGSYLVDPDVVIQLKSAGLSEKVISAMVEKSSASSVPSMTPAAAPAKAAPLVDEVGVYFKDKNDKWVEMLPEVVNWKTGGFLKTLATDGIVKGDLNGHVQGKASKNSLNTPLDFLIYAPEGVAVTEYQLLHLHESGNSREFRSVTGGVIHASGGASRDEVEFEGKKIAPRMYEIVLANGVKNGDYGFLPPGAQSSSNMASSGKIYSFHVNE
jgi:hypothetical protein